MDGIKRYTFKDLPIGLEVKTLGFVRRARAMMERAHRTDFYMLFYVRRGSMSVEVDFERVELEEGMMLYVGVGQVCRFDSSGEYEGWAVLATETFVHGLVVGSAILRGSYVCSAGAGTMLARVEDERIPMLIEALEGETLTSAPYRQEVLEGYMRLVLLLFERAWQGEGVGRRCELVARFCSAVEEHMHTKHHVADYLTLLRVRDKVLSRSLRGALGVSPKEYIDRRRVLESKRILSYTDMSVKEIAYALGFDEATNFNKFFRRHTGVSPLAFRASQQSRVRV